MFHALNEYSLCVLIMKAPNSVSSPAGSQARFLLDGQPLAAVLPRMPESQLLAPFFV